MSDRLPWGLSDLPFIITDLDFHFIRDNSGHTWLYSIPHTGYKLSYLLWRTISQPLNIAQKFVQ